MEPQEYRDGYEYLEMLHRQNQKETQSFNDFSGYLESRAREKGIPIRGQFELTPLCNLDCVMCYVHLDAARIAGQPLITVDQWKSLIRQAVDAGMLNAILTGGECLTYPGFDELWGSLFNELYQTSGSFFRAISPKTVHSFLLNKTSRWTNG